jgi:hypothetical protein
MHSALAAAKNRVPFSVLAVEETGIGLIEDKVIKNHFASEMVYHHYRWTRGRAAAGARAALMVTPVHPCAREQK